MRLRRKLRDSIAAAALAAALGMTAMCAGAEIPDSYAPLIVRANPDSPTERVFDLTPAFERARRLNRHVLIYLGAAECPPCRQYTQFLVEHERELRPMFARVVVIDVRTSIRGPRPTFLLDGRRYSTLEFKAFMGNHDPGLAYPTLWLVDAQGRQARSLPRGVDQYLDVSRYRDWLSESEAETARRQRQGFATGEDALSPRVISKRADTRRANCTAQKA